VGEGYIFFRSKCYPKRYPKQIMGYGLNRNPLKYMVGMRRFELPTPSSRTKCATRLRYIPMVRSSFFVEEVFEVLPDDDRPQGVADGF
jgi:hypothetical protein